ncbi:MAG: hypothetical protein JSW23_07715 [Planctomycetota bacterium]|nr:MAG: hypothetical protein JSW23_07715 [Planctomycetota bacterium]
MSEPNVVSLNAIRKAEESTVGPKAASLSRMMRIGLPVPPGFCVTEAAFRRHITANNLTDKIQSALDKLTKAKPHAAASLLSELRHAIIDAPVADALRDDIASHYRALAAERLAVRSSATAEDLPGHSFAGQYDTCLGVADLPACIDAVKICWASLWTDRAYTYRQTNGFDHLKVNMAVIVQSLVPADAAGVIFTADPLTGYSSRIVIEACFGLADSLVSGKVSPDRFRIARDTLTIISRNISEKKSKSVLAPRAGVHQQAVPPHLAEQPCIDDTLITKLAKLAQKAERKFGSPQDIEWAVSGNRLFFLQSRPVTSRPPQKSWQDRQVWTNAAVRDVAPDVVTPTFWSLMEQCIDPLFGPLFRVVGADIGDNPLAGLVAGRVYFNINTIMAIVRNLPASAHTAIACSAGGQHIQQFDLGQLDIPPEDLPEFKHCLIKALLRLPISICQIYRHRTAKSFAFLQILAHTNKTNRMRDLTKTSSTELVNLLLGTIEKSFNEVNLLYVFVPLSWLPLVYGFCRRWLGDENGRLANSLLAGAADMQDVQAGIALWELAQKAAADPALRQTVLSADNWQKLQPSLTASPSARDFLKAWDEFMTLHGHHCRGEILLFVPRWYETPDYILSIVKTYIEAADKHNPLSDLNKRINQREQLLDDTLKKLRNPLKRILLKRAVLKARKALAFRENVKSEVVRLLSRSREALLELGRRLTADQIFESPDDIFFVTFQELPAVVDNTADFDIRQTIRDRRLEYEKNKSLSPPPVVVGRFDPDKYTPPEIDTDAAVLHGIATSPGAVTGPARVILRSDDRQHVLPGEILVAPFTDPGWTPYFVTAAGVVMDQGGLLSHGSIIAREFGIPAVVNVGPATKIIKTGQKIHLDANNGHVTISPDNQST